jgi:hypothetical protein
MMDQPEAKSGPCGQWLTEDEYAQAAGLDLDPARELIRKAGLMVKTIAGRGYVWVDDPAKIFSLDPPAPAETEGEASSGPLPPSGGDGGSDVVGGLERAGEDQALVSDGLPARFSGVSQLALQTERAISLVERSLSTFVMMHQEVVAEKDRYAELHREGMGERDRLIEDARAKVAELESRLRDKDQEIADFKMLVEVLEGSKDRSRSEAPGPLVGDGKASVGDLMEEQLRYIMEDQMIRNLLDD